VRGVDRNLCVELQFVNQDLEWTDLRSREFGSENVGPSLARLQPLLLVTPKFFRPEFTPSWMTVVMAVDLGVAFETHSYRIINSALTTFVAWNYVVGLDLHTAESMANATPTMTRS
jgi:hypothetical protein